MMKLISSRLRCTLSIISRTNHINLKETYTPALLKRTLFTGQQCCVERVIIHKDIIDKHKKKVAEEKAEASSYSQDALENLVREQEKQQLQSVSPTVVQDNDMPISLMTNPYQRPHPRCILCEYNVPLEYKNTRLLSQFVSPHTGRIYGRHITGLCLYMQRRVATLIKRARYFGYMPYVIKEPVFLKDPKLFDPFRKR